MCPIIHFVRGNDFKYISQGIFPFDSNNVFMFSCAHPHPYSDIIGKYLGIITLLLECKNKLWLLFCY